jgi:hypothetical protein
MKKMNAQSLAQLVTIAERLGVLSPEDTPRDD